MWSDIIIYVGFFGGFFVLRLIVATLVFFWILPDDDRCPICNAHTLRVTHGFWNRVTPWLRTSWCYECNWSGLLRHGKAVSSGDPASTAVPSAPAVAPRPVRTDP